MFADLDKTRNLPAEPLKIYSKKEWGGREPKSVKEIEFPILKVVMNFNTDGVECLMRKHCFVSLQDMQNTHMNKDGCSDIKYNFLIGADGNVYEGRGWFAKSCKSLKFPKFRDFRLDIGFIGNYGKGFKIPKKSFDKAYYLIEHGVDLGYVRNLYEIYVSPSTDNYEIDWTNADEGKIEKQIHPRDAPYSED